MLVSEKQMLSLMAFLNYIINHESMPSIVKDNASLLQVEIITQQSDEPKEIKNDEYHPPFQGEIKGFNHDPQINQPKIDINRCHHESHNTSPVRLCIKCYEYFTDCQHESDGAVYTCAISDVAIRDIKLKCKKCGELYR